MKLAALFMTHKNMVQVKNLLKFFEDSSVECFIHIDKKYEGDFLQAKVQLEKQANIHVLDKRYSGTLSDWSLVRITMLLAESAAAFADKNGFEFNYYGLFSGQDYPIKPWKDFWEALKKKESRAFIDISRYGENGITDMFNKPRYWRIQNFLYTWIQNKTLRKLIKVPVYGYEKLAAAILGKPSDRLKKMGISIYQGSAWWIIDEETIKWILRESNKKGNRYIKIIKNTSTPEEHFFQTMCMMSPWKERFSIGDNKHIFCNFTPAGKPITGHPYTIQIEDVMKTGEWMNCPSYFFARKFDMETNTDAIEWIDKKVL